MLMKGGASSQAIYRTFMAGLDGTPMPSYMDDLPEKKRWPLVHYIQSLSGISGSKLTDEPGGTSTLIAANLSKDISLNVNDKLWKKVQAASVLLRPIRARDKWPDKVELKIAKGPSQIAFRFEWQDIEPDRAIRVTTDFMDGIALQFVPKGMPRDYVGIPFFGMGDLQEKVHIWNWKATASSVGKTKRVITVLEANGFGTLEDQPDAVQTVDGAAEWKDGTWVVVMRQILDAGSAFNIHQSIPVAIAAWDGNERDRAGQKSVSEWMELMLEQ
jgi:DMSO reductase family type II enzyme heme b subunit